MKFKPGDRVVVRSSGRKATVIVTPEIVEPLDLDLVCLKLDGARSCVMSESWVDYLNPVDWLAELA